MPWHVGIDTGGTFTDLAAVNIETHETITLKVPSTPSNPADAIIQALDRFGRQAGIEASGIRTLAHGTTVATNAILQLKGAKTGLLITHGFSATYPARPGTRPQGPDLIDPTYQKTPTLVPLSLTRGIPERIGFDGEVLQPIDVEAVRQAARELRKSGVGSVAICFLFSFMSDAHEKEAARVLKEEFPECRVSLSSEIMPVIREFPRLSTTVLDAYVGPIIQSYFDDLARRLEDAGIDLNRLFIMQSNGGLMRINIAARYPNETLMSGPAAGVNYAAELARAYKWKNVVTFDMGGTSTDISTIVDGQPTTISDGRIGDQEIGTPMVEVATIGAGGGSIAAIGKDGLLKVGPESAGASPGPACYGLGGQRATVTDANVMLGYVDPGRFLPDAPADVAGLARTALAEIGDRLDRDPIHAALGIRRIVNAQMGGSLRLKIAEKGGDPRDFTLVAFGGAGPLHAAELAREAGIGRVVIPPSPGVTCAVGLLLSDVTHIYRQSFLKPLSQVDAADVNARYEAMKAKAILESVEEGFDESDLTLSGQMELRYAHQGYQLVVDVPLTLDGQSDIQAIRRSFDEAHLRVYGVSAQGEEVELVTLRLQSVASMPKLKLNGHAAAGRSLEPTGRRKAYFAECDGFIDVPIFQRDAIGPDLDLPGPAIIEQPDSTFLVGPGQRLTADAHGNLIIDTANGMKP